VTEGNLVEGGSAFSTLLTTIVSLDPIYLRFTVDEGTYLAYARLDEGTGGAAQARGRPVRARLADEDEYRHMGYLDFVDNRIDEATDTLSLRGLLPNPNLVLTPGLFARVQVQGKGPYPALLIPDEAVLTDQAHRFVYVVGSDGRAVRREVKPGPLHGNLRVIEDGLSADDPVVIQGMQRVRPGAMVMAEKTAIAPPAAGPENRGP
jgi:RND family efflux transporter MFP subunit